METTMQQALGYQMSDETEDDTALYDDAKANDDGYRISAEDLRAKYGI
ncbi:MAG: hypothetical protein LBI54_06645 [Lachnospiraceae bacterium]|nr:hypothetical protein [Lachnospiraceae bacterium]